MVNILLAGLPEHLRVNFESAREQHDPTFIYGFTYMQAQRLLPEASAALIYPFMQFQQASRESGEYPEAYGLLAYTKAVSFRVPALMILDG